MRIKNIVPNPDPDYIQYPWLVTIIRVDKTEKIAKAREHHLVAWLQQTNQTMEYAHLFNSITSSFDKDEFYSDQLSIYDYL